MVMNLKFDFPLPSKEEIATFKVLAEDFPKEWMAGTSGFTKTF